MHEFLLIGLLARIPWVGPRVLYRIQRTGWAFRPRTWSELADDMAGHRPMVLSVDVFDTCVVRDLAGDQAIERAADNLSQQRGHRSPPGQGQAIDRVEVAAELERSLCQPVPGAAEALGRIRSGGTDVVFVSDTDRSSELLIDILRSSGIFVDGDRLVASCEANATKSDGSLFPTIFGDRPRNKRRVEVWHVGNHLWADVTMAAAAGLKPIPLLSADLNRYEQSMALRPAGTGPAVAAAARSARLAIDADRESGILDAGRAAMQTLGADVAGQTMVAFMLWAAERCREESIDHVGFLARDGELPLEVARAMPDDHWGGRSLRYIQASRFTWSLAAAAALGVDHWLKVGTDEADGFLHSKRHHIPFDTLLARIGLEPSDLTGEAAHRGLAGLDPGHPLPAEAVDEWIALLADPTIHDLIGARADNRLALIVDRLRADGLPTGRYALVDVGWRGRLATQVSAVLSQVVGEEPIHLHFGGDKVLPDVDSSAVIHRFAFDGVSDPHPITSPVSCVETITASGRPRVVEYRRGDDGEVEMIFDRPTDETHDRRELWSGALLTASRLPARSSLDRWGVAEDGLADETRTVLGHWWNGPTRAEVDVLSDLTFEHDEAGTAVRPLVTPYRLTELSRGRSFGLRQWPQGSLVASGPLMGTAVRLSKRLLRSNGS